ncbi:hypothetical protein XI06_07220 [Bradyrhizobium sp. CCBAU 11434]|nr:hypothetical protein [Bradyrhizobium sp. CCBAU 11434]
MRIASVAQFPRPAFKSAMSCRPLAAARSSGGSLPHQDLRHVVPLSVEVLAIISDQVTTGRFRCRIHGVRHVRVDKVTGTIQISGSNMQWLMQVDDEM